MANKSPHLMSIVEWPTRDSEGIGVSVKDGWNFGMGLFLFFLIGAPIIMIVGGLIALLFFLVMGSI